MTSRPGLPRAVLAASALSVIALVTILEAESGSESICLKSMISEAAATSCGAKVKRLEDHAAQPEPRNGQITRFSQDEVNSYLALELSSKYHPSLKCLLTTFQEARLQGMATLNFDYLSMKKTNILSKLIAKMFSGIHGLNVRGTIHAGGGKAHFELEEASFDGAVLPNFLVEEIISTVGRKQNPPFDPLRPSQMPYAIESVELHDGYIVVRQ